MKPFNLAAVYGAIACLLCLASCAQEQPKAIEKTDLLPTAPAVSRDSNANSNAATAPTVATDTLPAPDTAAASRKRERPQTLPPTFSVVDSVINLGSLPTDTLVKVQFDFSNAGDKPLEISGVDRSCGCTAASFPFLPIVGGERQSIKAELNTKGKTGKQRIRLTVHSNDPNSPHTLYIQAVVGGR